MKVKRFFASDMRKALNQVRDEFGLDAVILSNRTQKQGIEIVAGFEEKKNHFSASNETRVQNSKDIEWVEDPLLIELKENISSIKHLIGDHLSDLIYKEYKRKHPIETSLRIKMMGWGIEKDLTKKIADLIEKKENLDLCLDESKKTIEEIINLYPDLLSRSKGTFAFFGHSGVGKTSMILKLATALAIKKGPSEIAFITTDSQRMSGFDPLRNYSKIIDCPIKSVSSGQELKETIDLFAEKNFLFIDTPSLIGGENSALMQREIFDPLLDKIDSFLVLDGRDHFLNNSMAFEVYSDFQLKAAMMTKLDETKIIGDALSVLMKNNLPLAYCSKGSKIPDDLFYPNINVLIKRFFGDGKEEHNALDQILLVDLIEEK